MKSKLELHQAIFGTNCSLELLEKRGKRLEQKTKKSKKKKIQT